MKRKVSNSDSTRASRCPLAALDVADLSFVARGLEALVRRSKTDQERRGLTTKLARGGDPAVCAVRAVREWLELAGIAEGTVFRSVDRHGNVNNDMRCLRYRVSARRPDRPMCSGTI